MPRRKLNRTPSLGNTFTTNANNTFGKKTLTWSIALPAETRIRFCSLHAIDLFQTDFAPQYFTLSTSRQINAKFFRFTTEWFALFSRFCKTSFDIPSQFYYDNSPYCAQSEYWYTRDSHETGIIVVAQHNANRNQKRVCFVTNIQKTFGTVQHRITSTSNANTQIAMESYKLCLERSDLMNYSSESIAELRVYWLTASVCVQRVIWLFCAALWMQNLFHFTVSRQTMNKVQTQYQRIRRTETAAAFTII